MKIAKEEIFGPVMCVLKFDSEEEVQTPHPGYLFGYGYSYLRKRVLKLVFLSQSPYKVVNFFFTLRIS